MSADKIPHIVPKAFPPSSMAVINVPSDFARVVSIAAVKNRRTYEEQILEWAQMGAECSRQHQPKEAGRKNRK